MSIQNTILVMSHPEHIETLQSDFNKLQEEISEFPCNLIINFSSKHVLRATVTPTTHYGHQMRHNLPSMMEFPDIYFQKDDRYRILICLHELIHACQNHTCFARYHENIMTKNQEHQALANLAVAMEPEENKKEVATDYFKYQLQTTSMYYKIIFEAWNHLYMKMEFSKLFEEELTHVYDELSSGTKEGLFDSWGHDYNFEVHTKLLEITFFAKICEDYPIKSSFDELAKFWENKLRTISQGKEFEKLVAVVEKMTSVQAYPKSESLELAYLIMAQEYWDGTVFD